MTSATRKSPNVDEYLAYRERFSNWGRWGPDDQLGTLNHITPEVRLQAAALVNEGRTISLADPMATMPGPLAPLPAQHYMLIGPRGSRDYIGVQFHGRTFTHIDALCHIFTGDGRMYNGYPMSEITTEGAPRNSIDAWKSGIFTRGVLYDIPRVRGTAYVDVDSPVHSWDLEDAAKAQGVEPRAGDAVLVRSGKGAFLAAHPDIQLTASPSRYVRNGEHASTPGVHASVAEFLYEHDAALLGWDFLDASDQGYPPPTQADPRSVPVHDIVIPYMGLPLVDNMNLEELAGVCAERGRWEFLFIVAPLVVPGGTGSPANPLAVI